MVYGCPQCGSERIYSEADVHGVVQVFLGDIEDVVVVDSKEIHEATLELDMDSMKHGTCHDCKANFRLPKLDVVP